MHKIIIVLTYLLVLGSACSTATSNNESVNTSSIDYRFILIRHAEKQTGKDPGLTEEGILRSEKLAALLSQEKISAIYSTEYNRTRETVTPISLESETAIQSYTPMDEAFLPSVFTNYPNGGLFVVTGHSNTIPGLVNQLIGEDRFEQLSEEDYNDLFIVSCSALGTGSVIQLAY